MTFHGSTVAAITAGGRRSMLKLAQRMTNNFCAGVCASTVHKWNKLNASNVDEDVRVMTRKSVDDPGEPVVVRGVRDAVDQCRVWDVDKGWFKVLCVTIPYTTAENTIAAAQDCS